MGLLFNITGDFVKIELLEILRCPKKGPRLKLETDPNTLKEVETGWLTSEDGQHRYPINNSIPRFVPESNYATKTVWNGTILARPN